MKDKDHDVEMLLAILRLWGELGEGRRDRMIRAILAYYGKEAARRHCPEGPAR